MTQDRYEISAAGISLLCLTASFFLKDIQTLLWTGGAMTAANFLLLCYSLFRRQHISLFTLLLFLFQAGLFCRIFFLMDQMPGLSHFSYEKIPLWFEWIGYAGIQVLKAFDTPDVLELFRVNLMENIIPQSSVARAAVLGLRASAAFFVMGFFFSFFNSPLFLNFPGGAARRMALRAFVLIIFSMSVYIWGVHLGAGEWARWLLFDIVTTLDIADAVPLFYSSYALPLKTTMWTCLFSLTFRILFGLSLIGLLNRHVLRLLAGDEFIQKMTEIAVSPEYAVEKRTAAMYRLEQRKAVAESSIPDLVKLLGDSSYPIRNAAESALQAIDPAWAAGKYGRKVLPELLKMLRSKDKKMQSSAARMLGRMGEIGANAVPELLKMLQSEDAGQRRVSAESMERIGPAAIPRLVRGLEKADEEMSRSILDILQAIRPAWQSEESVKTEISRYIRMMSHEDGAVRGAAFRVIGIIGPESEEIVPFLLDALSDNNTRRSAIRLLGKMGKNARPALPRLIEILAENDKSVSGPAQQALDNIDPEWRKSAEAGKAVRMFIHALAQGDESPYEKPEAALLQIGFSAIPPLTETLADMNRNLQSKAAKMLKAIHPSWAKSEYAVQAVPFLTAALEDENWYVRSSAARVLGMIGPPARQAVPLLVKGMADSNKNVRASFKAALDRVMLKNHVFAEDQEQKDGPAVQSEREDVIRLLRELGDKDSKVRMNAALSLGKLEPPPAEALSHLMELLADGDRDVREAASVSLGTIDHQWRDKEEVSVLIRPLLQAQSGEPSRFQHPAEAMNTIGRGAVRHLIPMVPDSNRVIANAAAHFLEQIDPRWPLSEEAPAAVPALAEKLTAEQWFVRCSAAEILGKIGPSAQKAVPFLVKGLSDKNKKVRGACKEAMDKILLKKKESAKE